MPNQNKCSDCQFEGESHSQSCFHYIEKPYVSNQNKQEGWKEKAKQLAKAYAVTDYLYSEENYPKEDVDKALENLLTFIEQTIHQEVSKVLDRIDQDDIEYMKGRNEVLREIKQKWNN